MLLGGDWQLFRPKVIVLEALAPVTIVAHSLGGNICLRYAGVQAVVAKSFSRIYFRNAINLGLAVLQSLDAPDALQNGDEIEIDFAGGRILSAGRVFTFFPLPESVMGIVQAGGLLEWTKKKLATP